MTNWAFYLYLDLLQYKGNIKQKNDLIIINTIYPGNSYIWIDYHFIDRKAGKIVFQKSSRENI